MNKEFKNLLDKGLSKDNAKKDLITLMITLKRLEERAKNTYQDLLKNNLSELNNEHKNLLTKIMNEEETHMMIADKLLQIISDYDFDMELVIFKLP